MRTKKVAEVLTPECMAAGANTEQAASCSNKIAELLGNDTLLFISAIEACAFCAALSAADSQESFLARFADLDMQVLGFSR